MPATPRLNSECPAEQGGVITSGQSQNAVSAYITSEQILPFDFAEQNVDEDTNNTRVSLSSPLLANTRRSLCTFAFENIMLVTLLWVEIV